MISEQTQSKAGYQGRRALHNEKGSVFQEDIKS